MQGISISIAPGATASFHFPPNAGTPGQDLIGLPVRNYGPADDNTNQVHAAALTPPALGEAWLGQGGILIATIPAMLGMPGRHVIASREEARFKFGPSADVQSATSHVDGRANTAALVTHAEHHPAAEWAHRYTADGHADFFLPARFDLLMAHLQAPQVFAKEGWYWTSTQIGSDYAFAQYFANGGSSWDGKVNEFRVRAVRTIQL